MRSFCFLAAVALTWSLPGCPAEDNPCSGVDCSDHGFCGVTPHDTPLCLCDVGYRNDGPTQCVPDEGADCTSDADCDDSNPCSSSNTCSNGTCMAGGTDKDGDQDGYYDAACPGGNDCDDGDPDANPGAVEGSSSPLSCSDAVDNDCDGKTDGEDSSCQGPAGVYYVRTDGDDDNTGEENTPQGAWRTIQKAAETLDAGETVRVQPGTYCEEVHPQNSGQDGQPITYRADGWAVLSGETTRDFAFHLDQRDYIVIDGFEMTLYRDSGGDDGTVYLGNSSHNVIRNCHIHHTGRDGINLSGSSSQNTVENCLIVNAYDDGITPGGSDNVLRNCTVFASGEWGIEQQGGNNIIFENNIIWDDISNTGGSWTWRYNDFRDGLLPGDGNLQQDPRFVDTASNDFHLSHTAAGQGEDSPCIDAGSDTAANLGLDTRSTRTDGVPDSGTVDLGYHYP
jgi:parallel beta-helix repeat protein